MATREEALFCKIAVKNKLLTPEQCQECEQLRKQSGSDKGLIDIVIEKGYVAPKVVLAIFKAQAELTADQSRRPVKEMAESESSFNLLEPGQKPAILENQPTIQGEVVRDDAPTPILPATPQPGDEAYEKIKREISQMPFGSETAKKAENVVYNINIRNFQSTEANRTATGEQPKPEDGALVPYNAGLTLSRNDLSEQQLLALLRGDAVNLPAKYDGAAQLPAPAAAREMAPSAVQHNILTAVRQNLLITIIGLGIMATMIVMGAIYISRAGGNGPIINFNPGASNQQQQQPIVTGPAMGVAQMNMEELISTMYSGSKFMKQAAAKTIGQKMLGDEIKDVRGIDALVEGLNDPDREVVDMCYYWLGKFKDAGLRESAFSSVFTLFGHEGYSVRFRDKCLDVVAVLEIPEADLLGLLERGVKDADPGIRKKSVGMLAKYDSQRAIEVIRPLASDADPATADDAIKTLWQKRAAVPGYDPVMLALKDPATTPDGLKRLLVSIAQNKPPGYVGEVALFISHADRTVKLEVLKTLEAYGPDAEAAFTDPFKRAFIQARDATIAAQPPDVELRGIMLVTLAKIHGLQSGDLLFQFATTDPDQQIMAQAQAVIDDKNSGCPEEIRQRLEGWRQVVIRKLIDAQKALLVEAWDLLQKKELEAFYPKAEPLLNDGNQYTDMALKETEFKDRATFNQKCLDARKSGGYVYMVDPAAPPPVDPATPTPKTWLKVDAVWEAVKKASDDLAARFLFKEALDKLNSTPPEVLAMEGMAQQLEVAKKNLRETADGYAKAAVAMAEQDMSKEDFTAADAKLTELEAKFTKDAFPAANKEASDGRKGYLRDFREWRGKIMVLTGRETEQDILNKFGIPLRRPMNFGVLCKVTLQQARLVFEVQGDPKQGGNFVWAVPAKPPRDSSDFTALVLTIGAPSDSTTTITVQCGGCTYQFVTQNQGKIVVFLDNRMQAGGFGQKRANIDSVSIQIAYPPHPNATSSPKIFIGDIMLTGTATP
jgi:hypothetical protein